LSCFSTQLEADAFAVSINEFNLNLPANVSAFPEGEVERDLVRQVARAEAAMYSLAKKCIERTGDVIDYFGKFRS
jgi:hypothetical protein